MKMMNVLDMSGNQIQNFLVHNGNVVGSGTTLTAMAGKLAYDQGDRALYLGYDAGSNGQSDLQWTRLVDTAHIGSVIGDYAIPVGREITEVKTNYLNGRVELVFKAKLGNSPFSAYIGEVTSDNCGLMSPNAYEAVSDFIYMAKDIRSTLYEFSSSKILWNDAYGWGNHADAGYAKAYKVEKAVESNEKPGQENTFDNINMLKQSSGKNDWVQRGVVFDSVSLRLLCEYTRDSGAESAYVKTWSGYNDIREAGAYQVAGNLLFVKGNASVYKYDNGGWVLYLSGASQDVIGKIDAISNALGLEGGNDKDEDPNKNFIDTWNEMKDFFSGVDNQEDLLSIIAGFNNTLSDKADKNEVIMQPDNGNVGDVLTLGNSNAEWTKKKIIRHSSRRAGSTIINEAANGTWTIDITDLHTSDVSVSVYKVTDGNLGAVYEQILADVYVEAFEDGDKTGQQVRIVFGNVLSSDVFRAVIIA